MLKFLNQAWSYEDTDILKINRLQDIHRYKEYGDYKITILDFDMISSIKKWKIQMKRRIRELVSSALLDSETAEDAIQKIYEPFKVYLIEGHASVLHIYGKTMSTKAL